MRKAFINMNRLIIIGNGFDLAHGLPTSYKDFIDDYWKSACKVKETRKLEYDDDHFVKLSCELGSMYSDLDCAAFNNITSYKELMTLVKGNRENGYGYFDVSFKNSFFKIICDNSIENWVDVENEYYKKLKIIVKLASLSNREKKAQTIILNKEFEQVKNLLEKYLKEKVEEKYDFTLFRDNPIQDILLPELINRFDEKEFLNEFQNSDQLYVKEFLQKAQKNYDLTTFFLNFNYTKLVQEYFYGFAYAKQINYIHGKLNDSINRVNFGFGDEMDDDYKMIENIDDNEYLRNFKSFQYLQSSNYKRLLDFVESDQKFQVYIMGHSCGLSDRTMLNTIFEHPNCISIKVFYHQKENGIDNYTEIIQNISRHFNKKKLMREKIVNKTLCQPLPQIQLPLR
ncbi:AbiH family protein [Flavobacterium sp. LB3R33]|uniref:AbiH family protein n=1 Tax=Flavobacterium sp. LB3R33 TaxID=3401721 RepID=UPI003AAF66F3